MRNRRHVKRTPPTISELKHVITICWVLYGSAIYLGATFFVFQVSTWWWIALLVSTMLTIKTHGGARLMIAKLEDRREH